MHGNVNVKLVMNRLLWEQSMDLKGQRWGKYLYWSRMQQMSSVVPDKDADGL